LVQEEKPISVKDENESILGFNEKTDKQNMIIDESSPRAPNLESTSPKPHIEETVELQFHDLIDETMEIQVQVQ